MLPAVTATASLMPVMRWSWLFNPGDPAQVARALVRFGELAELGREEELRRFFNEFLPEARIDQHV